MSLHLRYAARSDVGLIRPGNEDSGYAGPNLLMVADGMGGHAAGELASAIAVATVAELDVEPPPAGELLSALGDAIVTTGENIADVIAVDPDLTGMGTTVTGLYWLRGRLALVHIGDSRAYLMRDGELSQMTHDHTYVQTLVDAGRITEEEAAVHPRRSLIMRALDGINPVEADLSVREAKVGDRLMLCTDGLSGVLSARELEAILSDGDPTGCVTRLVDRALERGAPDNVTVVVADVIEVPDIAPGIPAVADSLEPVVVGAAGEPRVRLRLPGIPFPDDAQPDPDRPEVPPMLDEGPPTAPQPLIDTSIIVPGANPERRSRREAEELAARKARRNRRWFIAGGSALAVVLVLLAGVLLVGNWIRSQWYVGLYGNAGTGHVAIYQGIPQTLLGQPLSSMRIDTQLQIWTLPVLNQEQVNKGMVANSEADAQRIVTDLRASADACQRFPDLCTGTAP